MVPSAGWNLQILLLLVTDRGPYRFPAGLGCGHHGARDSHGAQEQVWVAWVAGVLEDLATWYRIEVGLS